VTVADAIVAELDDAQLARLAERLRPFLAEQGDDRLLTPAAAAARLGLHVKTLTRAARAGRVPGARRVGARWRFDAAALELLPPAGHHVEVPSPARTPRRTSSTAAAIRSAPR
jgi:excisionase family DNA binding protein